MSLLAARGVSRAFGRRIALRPTDVTLDEGEVVALVGPNGAGKSTLRARSSRPPEPSSVTRRSGGCLSGPPTTGG